MSLSFGTKYFNPRTPCGVRHERANLLHTKSIFQSTHPLRGATASVVDNLAVTVVFQSTHPLRGATCRSCRGLCDAKNFNPRTPCGVRPQFLIHIGGFLEISIHAPLAGCDLVHSKHKFGLPGISIHAPLAGCDSPSRGLAGWIVDFNPRTPCGVRRGVIGDIHIVKQFQSTHPLRGATVTKVTNRIVIGQFQSTHPLRGATANLTNSYPQICTKATKGIC